MGMADAAARWSRRWRLARSRSFDARSDVARWAELEEDDSYGLGLGLGDGEALLTGSHGA